MKTSTTIIFCSLLFTFCGTKDKQSQLDSLKKQRADLNEKIRTLEDAIAVEQGDAASAKVKNVFVSALKTGLFRHYVEVQGKVDAEENISISAKMGGSVAKIYVAEGDEVKEGQALAGLENDVLVKSMEELKNALDLASEIFRKQQNLWDQKIGSEVQYLTAKNNKDGLEKKLATLNEQLDLSQLRSSINGTVDAIDIKLGQMLMPGLPAIRIVNFNKLKVKAEVPESYASKVKKGNQSIVVFPDLNLEVKSKITHTAKVINPTTRTFTAEAALEGGKNEYHPNMIVVLKIIDYEKDSAIVIPVNVIQYSTTGTFVFIAYRDGEKIIARKQPILTGNSYQGKTEILSGLKQDDLLITTGYQELQEGDVIRY